MPVLRIVSLARTLLISAQLVLAPTVLKATNVSLIAEMASSQVLMFVLLVITLLSALLATQLPLSVRAV